MKAFDICLEILTERLAQLEEEEEEEEENSEALFIVKILEVARERTKD